MKLYTKIEKEGEQAIYEEVKVIPSISVLARGAAYNYLMDTCHGITPETAIALLETILVDRSPAMYGKLADNS